MINKSLKELIETNALALATSNKNNPHCIAVGFAKVLSKNQILITDNYMHTTPENIKNNSNIAIAIWNRDWEKDCKGYEIIGKAEYFTKGKYHEIIKQIPENKGLSCKGAILISVSKIKRLA